MEIDKKKLGINIKGIRVNKLKCTMEEFANLIDSGKSNVSRWERGENIPNDLTLTKIAELGGITVNELLYGSPKEFAYNVLIKELDSDTPLKKVIYQTIADDSETHAKAISLITERFNDIYARLLISIANMPNGKIDDIYDETDLIIRTAITFFSVKEVKTFTEYYEALNKIIKQAHDLDSSIAAGSIEEIEQRLLRKGMNEVEAHKEAINRYFYTKAFSAVQDLEDKLEEIYKEYQSK